MNPHDPRHGTPAGYSQHRRDGEDACIPCRRAASAHAAEKNARWETDDIALTDGAWRFDPFRRVQVWVPSPDATPPVDAHGLIVCPTCHARADETCRTKTGNRAAEHGDRLIPRQCACGNAIEGRRRRCSLCVAETKADAKRRERRRARARQRRRAANREDVAA